MRRPALAALLGTLAVACAAPPATPHPPARPGKTQIVLENHVAWPYTVERAALVIDGRLLSLTTRLPEPGGARQIAEVSLAPGQHTLALLVDAAYPGAVLDRGCALRMRKAVPIRIDAAPETLVVDLYAKGRTAPFRDGLDIAVTTRGSVAAPKPAPGVALGPPPEECGRSDAEAEAALCRIGARIASANDAGDAAWASCLADKRTKLRALVTMRDERQELANNAGEPLQRDHQQAVVGLVYRRIAAVASQIEGCQSAGIELARALDRDVPGNTCPDFWPLDADTTRDASLHVDPR